MRLTIIPLKFVLFPAKITGKITREICLGTHVHHTYAIVIKSVNEFIKLLGTETEWMGTLWLWLQLPLISSRAIILGSQASQGIYPALP